MVRRIEGVPPIEVYIGQNGHVCIKQEDPMGVSDDDAVVVMLPTHVPLIIKWLQEAAAQVEGVPVGIIEKNDEE